MVGPGNHGDDSLPGYDKNPKPQAFNNGLTNEQDDTIDRIRSLFVGAKIDLESLGRHRNYSLAITKLEEADLWLNNRRHVAP